MFRLILSIFLVTSATLASAQWNTSSTHIYNTNSGNVGIGTGPTVNSKLEIRGSSIRVSESDIRYVEISQDANGQPYGRNWTNAYAGGREFKISGFSHLPDNTGSTKKDIIHFDGYNLLFLKDNGGNVGIGTTTPDGKLTIDAGYNDNAKQGLYVKAMAGTHHSGPAVILDNTATWEYGRSFIRGISRTSSSTVYTDICLYNGRVGINTDYPDTELTVNGVIHSKEVRVDLNITGPDYVFEDDYKLPSLTEVALYIKKNKHLPEVPSANDMEKNGVNLSEMNMLLLKKVEELTLYVISQNKKMEEQQAEIEKLKEAIQEAKK